MAGAAQSESVLKVAPSKSCVSKARGTLSLFVLGNPTYKSSS